MIRLPDACLRHRDDCQPLAQIEADDESSFVCCGRSERSDDPYRICWSTASMEEIGDYDERDLIDTMSVVAKALSVEANRRAT